MCRTRGFRNETVAVCSSDFKHLKAFSYAPHTGEGLARDNEAMRKRVLGSALPPADAPDGYEWLKLEELAEVEVTSEADGYPVESAFNFGAGPGWRAASPGKQRIRLAFDQPQSIRRMRLQFNEPDVARTQEFTVRWSGYSDELLK